MALNVGTDDFRDYDPDYCDGHECPINCDICQFQAALRGKMDDDWEPDDRDLEMGFDPYLGCYTDDC